MRTSMFIGLSAPSGSRAAGRIREIAAELGAETVQEGGQAHAHLAFGYCTCCGNPVAESTLRQANALNGPACEECRAVARKVLQQFRADAHRAWAEVKGQLPRVIMDIRAGADTPSFYRGFE